MDNIWRGFLLFFHGSNCTKHLCNVKTYFWCFLIIECVCVCVCGLGFSICDTGIIIHKRRGWRGTSCLSNNLPLVHFEFDNSWRTLVLVFFSITEFSFGFIFLPVAFFPGWVFLLPTHTLIHPGSDGDCVTFLFRVRELCDLFSLIPAVTDVGVLATPGRTSGMEACVLSVVSLLFSSWFSLSLLCCVWFLPLNKSCSLSLFCSFILTLCSFCLGL